jgi:hypothetical protein
MFETTSQLFIARKSMTSSAGSFTHLALRPSAGKGLPTLGKSQVVMVGH